MFDFTIDGRIVSVQEGTTILEAARSAGLHIPTLCYLKNVSSIGSCRLCVVEVEGTAGLVSSCNTLVKPGMVVHTNSDAITAARRTALQLIIADHGKKRRGKVAAGKGRMRTITSCSCAAMR